MSYRIFILLTIALFSFCDLENRYPDAGEFCTPMREIPECVQMDFRNKILFYKDKPENKIFKRFKFIEGEESLYSATNVNLAVFDDEIFFQMINRVEYEYNFETMKLELVVLGEHRIRIRIIKFPENSITKEETYIRMKGPRVSLWTRIKSAWNK